MRTTTITALVAGGALALTALGGVAVAVPDLVASTATTTTEPTEDATDDSTDDSTDAQDEAQDVSDDAERLAERTARIAEELAGLVEDGTITQDQADAVAGTLAEAGRGLGGGPGGHGGRGHGFGHVLHEALTTAATTLGLEEDALRERLQDGETLGEMADAEGVERADLVAALVAAAEAELAQRVEAGDLTQEQADQISATLTEKVTELLDRDGPVGRGGGHGGRSGGGSGDDDGTEGETDS